MLAAAMMLCAGCAKKGIEGGTEAQGVITDSGGMTAPDGMQIAESSDSADAQASASDILCLKVQALLKNGPDHSKAMLPGQ